MTAPATPPPSAPPILPPPTWTDSAGRAWQISLTIRQARPLRATALDILNPDNLAAILADETRQLDLLFALLADQATAHGLTTQEEFDRAMTADPDDFPRALAALLGRLSLFFRSLARHKPAATLAAAAAAVAARNQAPENETAQAAGPMIPSTPG